MIIRPLEKRDTKVAFSCGEPDLDAYFLKRAWTHECEGIARVYVLEDSATVGSIVGFYTLSNKSVDRGVIGTVLRKSLPKFPLPVTYIGCFAVSTSLQGQGIGLTLMGDALERYLSNAEQVGSTGVYLDSLNARSTAFYKKLGFVALLPPVPERQPMFLPMESLRKA